MKLHELTPTPGSKKRRQRVGRGDGSNWGGTAGRGHKGQKSRTGAAIRHHFEGGQTPTFRRIPKRGFNSGIKEVCEVVNVATLQELFEAGAVVDENALRMAGIVGKADAPLKHQSCLSCHVKVVAEKPDLKKDLTGCAKSKCHP